MPRAPSKSCRVRRPRLEAGMSVIAFQRHYWWLAELTRFARRLGLAARGPKPALATRIERHLRGLPPVPEPEPRPRRGRGRDSDQPLRRDTPVVSYASDARTRAFFRAELGPSFHFTYHLNRFRERHRGLTYGDLVDEWLAERERRRRPGYRAPLARHGKYNRFVRAFFADAANRGKSLADAAAAWNSVKFHPGDPTYRRSHDRRRKNGH
jgi:hypothetical protein